jgi:hypothetical protein
MSTAAPKIFLQQSGVGNRTLRAVVLPSKWYLTWKFDCGGKRQSFLLTSTRKSASPVTLARQNGLGGGGQPPFTKSGTYKFATKAA